MFIVGKAPKIGILFGWLLIPLVFTAFSAILYKLPLKAASVTRVDLS